MTKKLLSIVLGLVALVLPASAQFNSGLASIPNLQVATLTLTTSNLGVIYQLTPGRANVVATMISSVPGATVYMWDNTTNAPYFGTNTVISAGYISTTNYATNYVTSFVGYNGYTNWYTNVGQWTLLVTNNGSTNLMNPTAVFQASPNIVASYNNNVFCERGVAIAASTNCTVTIYYTVGR